MKSNLKINDFNTPREFIEAIRVKRIDELLSEISEIDEKIDVMKDPDKGSEWAWEKKYHPYRLKDYINFEKEKQDGLLVRIEQLIMDAN